MSNTTGEPNKTSGQYHSLKGTAVEVIGDLTGATTWQQSGKEEHGEGEAEYEAAQAQDYVDGATDRLTGYKESVVGALTDDKAKQTAGNVQKERGRVKQQANQPSTLQ